MGGKTVALVLAAALAAGRMAALTQAPLPRPVTGPGAPLFSSLVADPKEPEFFATYLLQRSPRLATNLGSVGFGQTMGILSSPDLHLSCFAGVFSSFDLSP